MDIIEFFGSHNIPFLVYLLLSRRAFVVNNDCQFPISELNNILKKGFSKIRIIEIDSPSNEVLQTLKRNIVLGTSNTVLEYYIFINPYEGSESIFMDLPERGWLVKTSYIFDIPEAPSFYPSEGWVLNDHLSFINEGLRSEFGAIDSYEDALKLADKLVKLTRRLLKVERIDLFKIKSKLGIKNDFVVHALTDIIRGNTTSLTVLKHNEFMVINIPKIIKKGAKIFKDTIKIRFSGLSEVSNDTFKQMINIVKDGLDYIDNKLSFLNDNDKNIIAISILLKVLKDSNEHLYKEVIEKFIGEKNE